MLLFLLLLSSAFFVSVRTADTPQRQPTNTLYFHSVNELSLDDINEHLGSSRKRLQGCEDGLPPLRPSVVSWRKALKAKLLRARPKPKPKPERKDFENCNAVRWSLIDGLLDWFRYVERNFEMGHEKLEETLDEYQFHDWELRDALQLFTIMARMEISGQSFEDEEASLSLEERLNSIHGRMKWIELRFDERPDDFVLLSIRRNMYLWTMIVKFDPLYSSKTSMNPWLEWSGPLPIKPSNNPHYDDWRLAAYNGFLAAVGLHRQFVPRRHGSIRPVDSKDTGIYLGERTYDVTTQRLKLVFPVANRRLEQAYELWKDGLGAMSKDKQVAMKWCLGIIKDLKDYFEFMERIPSVRNLEDSEVTRYKRFSDWYITLACQYVSSAQGIELNAEDQNLPSMDTIGNKDLASIFKKAARAREKSSSRSPSNPIKDPAFRIIREINFYLIFKALLDSNPSGFPFSRETWDFNMLRSLSLLSTAGGHKHVRRFESFLRQMEKYTNGKKKPEGLEDFAWDYGVYDLAKGFVPLHHWA